jgi:two-component sensor histidine kinase
MAVKLGFRRNRRDLLARSALAVLLYIAAVLGRQALHLILPGLVRYLTFLPALMAAGFLCGLVPSIVLLVAFAITEFFWIGPDYEQVTMRLILGLAFVVSGAAIVFPASYAVRVRNRLKMHEQRLVLINDELRHRIKNLFTIVCSLCTQTMSAQPNLGDMSRELIGRIQAVASAQDFLSIATSTGSELGGLTRAIIGPLCPQSARMKILGGSVLLPPHLTTSFALVLHELATNAVKYGAWQSNCEGTVVIKWSVDADRLRFCWREYGCELSAPRRRGFGSRLIQQSLLRAEVLHSFHPDGVECTISLKL